MADTIYEQLSAVVAKLDQVLDVYTGLLGPAGQSVTYPDGAEIDTLRETVAKFQGKLDSITGQASSDAEFVKNVIGGTSNDFISAKSYERTVRAYLAEDVDLNPDRTYNPDLALDTNRYSFGSINSDGGFVFPVDGFYLVAGAMKFATAPKGQASCNLIFNSIGPRSSLKDPDDQTQFIWNEVFYARKGDSVKLYLYYGGGQNPANTMKSGVSNTYILIGLMPCS